jgi:hypothetical protein
MNSMRSLPVVLVLALSHATLAAQTLRPGFPGKPIGGFGGISTDQFFQSQIQHAAGQLHTELVNLRNETTRLKVPLPVKVELSRLADRAVKEADDLRRLAAVTADRRRLLAADRQVDEAVDAFLARAQQLGAGSAGLNTAVARAQFADQQLHALFGTVDPNPGVGRILRTAAAVVDQVGNLREEARDEFPGNIYTPQLDRSIRSFGFRVGALARGREAGGTIAAAALEYDAAARKWHALAPGLNALTGNASVRLQIARVEGLFRHLGDQLGVIGGPNPPDFGFLNKGMFACGAGEGGGPRVSVFAQVGGRPIFDFFAFDPLFRGGVRVAVADLTGDGFPELVAAPGGPLPGQIGLPPIVRVFDGRTMNLISEFLAYDRTWTGGMQVAAANLTRQGRAIIVTGADVGAGPHVKAFDIATGREVASFFAYDRNFRGGVRVALGDVDGDGLPDIVTAPGPQHPPQIKVFSGLNSRLLANWMAYDATHTMGAYVATADISRNGRADVIVGPDVNGSGVVRVFDPLRGTRLGDVTPYPAKFRGGIRVAAHDVNNDGVLDVVCAPGPDVPAPVRVFDGRNSKPLVEFYPFERSFAGGVFIGAK